VTIIGADISTIEYIPRAGYDGYSGIASSASTISTIIIIPLSAVLLPLSLSNLIAGFSSRCPPAARVEQPELSSQS
jgi:hypothetical protein